jgi:branched-subunit amino acid permease
MCFWYAESVVEITAPSPSTPIIQTLKNPNLHDLQVYGIIVTVILCLIVFGGVKIINKVGPAFLIPVLLSILLIFIGIFSAHRLDKTGKLLSKVRQPDLECRTIEL